MFARYRLPIAILVLFLWTATSSYGQASGQETWKAGFQTTYIWQGKAGFPARYSGTNSLTPAPEPSYSLTATVMGGLRLWPGGEVYLNIETARGLALSGLLGLGGFTNGEMARTTGPIFRVYMARLFLRQTIPLNDVPLPIDSDVNQLADTTATHRLVVTAGNLAALDIFDDNIYSHDPRTQFMNWSLMTHGAYDYAADARGYSWGLALEWYHDDWVLRLGRFIQPYEPNQQALDPDFMKHYGDQLEIGHSHTIDGRPGAVRVLAFRNRAIMARYQDALDLAAKTGEPPDIGKVRTTEQIKFGFGLNVEQAVADDIGVFLRVSWADGKTETYAFTEIDRSISAGARIKGTSWGRAEDELFVGIVGNALSQERRDYLARGGISFFIGDGALDYRPETIVELLYTLRIVKWASLSIDWQHISNPAYNADRGPVELGAVRLHVEL